MKKQDEIPTTNPNEVESLIKRVKEGQLSKNDTDLLERLLRLLLLLLRAVEAKNTTISKLKRMLFGPRTDKEEKEPASASSKAEKEESSSADKNNPEQLSNEPVKDGKRRRGHGRIAAKQYTGAKKVICINDELEADGKCPHEGCSGRLYDPKEFQEFIRFSARPIIDATRYQQQVLRCVLCGARFAARLPAGVVAQKYDETADVMMALMKYGSGLPFYRLAKLQAGMGIPLPASTQFMSCEEVADILYPVFVVLARLASLGEVLCGVVTTVKIFS